MGRNRTERVDVLASRQRSLVTRRQLLEIGLGRRTVDRWVAAGRLLPLHRGVYRLRGHPTAWEQEVLAAILVVGAPAAAYGRTAGRLWGLEGMDSDLVELLVPAGRVITRSALLVHRSRLFARRDIVMVEGIPRTAPPRTLIDLASLVPSLDLEIVLDDALRRRMVTTGTMLRRVAPARCRGRAGSGHLRELLEDRSGDGMSGSGWETRLRRLLVDAGMQAPVRQHEVRDPAGRFVARLDLSYPDLRVGIEFDGFRHHSGRRAYDRDVRRQNRLEDLGWRLRRFTSTAVRGESREVVATVRTAIEQASV